MKKSDPAWLRRIFVRAAILPVIVITVLAGLLGWQMSELLATNRWLERTDRVISQANITQKLLIDLETGLRGFLITNRSEFLDPYLQAQSNAPRAITRLKGMVDRRQVAAVAALERDFAAWLAYSHDELLVQKHGSSFRSLELKRQGKEIMDRMRLSVAEVIRTENQLRMARSQAAERATWTVVGLGGMLTVLAGVLLAALTTHHLGQVAKAYEELLETRAAAEAELEKRARDLETADRQKDEFLAMLAHELRNPLAAVSNGVQVLKSGGVENVRLVRLREIMERQCQHLARLVDDLLDVSRLTRDRIELHCEEVDLAAALRNAEATVQPLLLARQHHLSIATPPAPLVLDADPVRLEQIFGNLLSNAAKYTPPGGQIDCTAEAVEEAGQRWAVVRVRDNGVGIGPEFLPHVFELFAQADRTLDRRDGGLGIGLTLVHRLVTLHHGEVTVQSEGLGRGAEFTVRLPALARTARTPVPSLPAEPAPERAARILLVEDNYDAAETMMELLDLWGHQVEVARDGRAAVVTAERDQPEVILLDIGLPLLSGYEVAEHLRSSIEADRQPVIIGLSGYGQPEDRERGVQAGFDYHLVKPVDADELRGLLEQVTAGAARHRIPQKA